MSVLVTVPATIANLGPGFDALGLAVDLRDRFRVTLASETTVTFSGAAGAPTGGVPLAARAARAVAARAGRPAGFAITADLAVPVARGLGSSAASIVGALVAANHLLGDPLDRDSLLEIAADLEGHPDNVAAALLGGVVVVASGPDGIRYGRFIPRVDLNLVLAVPDLAIPTEQARAVLPQTVPLADAVFNLSRAALLVGALLTGDEALLKTALDDRLHQPYRARLLPGFAEVVAAARDAGAHGAVLAGSGSTVCAFAPPGGQEAVGEAMRQAFARAGQRAAVRPVQVDVQGALIHA